MGDRDDGMPVTDTASSDPTPWIQALRSSHQRLGGLLEGLSAEQIVGPSYAKEWSIAQVASHLGSQAEIFDLFLSAGLTGSPAPGGDAFPPLWAAWDARSPQDQVSDSMRANEAFVSRVESLSEAERASFGLDAFGGHQTLASLLALRLGEHGVHTWDVAIGLDPAATLAADVTPLLLPRLSSVAARSGQRTAGDPVAVTTVDPAARFVVRTDPEVSIEQLQDDGADAPGSLELPAEAFVRLVYGRLDEAPGQVPASADDRLARLRTTFPGY